MKSLHRSTFPTKTTVGTSALIALGSLGCGQSPAPTPAPPSSSSIVEASASAPVRDGAEGKEHLSLAGEFAPWVVTLPNVARKTLYTWTTSAQIEALRKDPTLLTRSESPEHGTSYFEQVLEQRAQKKAALAKLLRSTPFAKQRYAWVAPFATRLGIGDESYGDELIRIDLKPEAWFVVMKTSSSELDVVDADNKPVSREEALAHPERLAAAYFVQDKPVTGYRASMAGPNERIGYREYVILNESMIAAYSLGTPEIAAELEKEIRALQGLYDHVKSGKQLPSAGMGLAPWMVEVCGKSWASVPKSDDPVEMYQASIAFADYAYLPGEANLRRLIDNLTQLKMGNQPFRHVPQVKFQSSATKTPAPPPKTTTPKMRGTH